MRCPDKIILLLLSLCVGVISQETYYWNPFAPVIDYVKNETARAQNFTAEQTKKFKEFMSEQQKQVESAIDQGYEQAETIKKTIDNYAEEQKKRMNEEVDNYIEQIKETGRQVAEKVSKQKHIGEIQNPEVILTVPAIITRHGYPCETHTIISQGYVLNIHRIPHSSKNDVVSPKTVLLQHGTFASSADWVLNGPNKGLAYVLSDAGYDVWMGNIRGNRYSKEHIKYNTDSEAYWNFSWHDVALHDEPAIIDYIINRKGSNTKITYIGHSMGTTIFFAMLALRPEYNNILKAGFALAPVVYTSDIKTPLKSLAPIATNIAYMEMLYGSHEFIPKNSAIGKLSSSCDTQNMDNLLCRNFMFYLCGYDEDQFNKTLLPAVLAHLGSGTSWKTVVHFAQLIVSKRFQQFDYGYFQNLVLYGSSEPPEYNLTNIKLPITLFWSKNDLFSSEHDVMSLYQKLPSDTTQLYLIQHPDFNHLDYLYAIDAPKLINNKILEFLNNTYKNTDTFSFKILFD